MKKNNQDLEYISNDWMDSERMLWTPSKLAQKALIYPQEIGTLISKKSHDNSRDTVDSYLFVMVLQGSGTFTIHNENYKVHEGNLVFLDCHTNYSHNSSKSDPWKIIWIHFNGKSMPFLYELFEAQNSSIVISTDMQPYLALFNQIKQTMIQQNQNCELYISQYLTQLVIMLVTASQEIQSISEGRSTEKWHQIRTYLEHNFTEKITLEELSRLFHVSKYYMLRGFKKQYNITIMQYLNQCRLNHAKKLLRFTTLQVEKIADACGVHDASYFNRMFRASEGVSAGSFRKQWRN